MNVRHAQIAAAALLVLSLAGCSGSSSTDARSPSAASPEELNAQPAAQKAASSLPTGPGPQAKYRVQDQPAAGSCHYRYTAVKEPLTDAKCTPGALNPKVTQATLKQTICSPSGYTKGIRPPVSVTGPEKAANAKSYSYTGPLHDAEYDHLISLELGGDPNDPRNLWVEPPSPGHKPGAGPNNPKDVVESKLHTAICSGKTQLAPAQQAIATDWTTALTKLRISK
ncbi:hypothetical protein [Streptomyces sp. NPDC051173]|uniref:hypothetical protein n=1 Tax=Streptomyces sp. NPDC051173 TaxID=3155164 RepID=UPI00344DB02E